MKVALVYDRLNTPYGGAEKLLLALKKIYPQAVLFTAIYDKKQATWAKVFEVKTSFLQKIPLIKNHHRIFAWIMPLAFESLNFSNFNLIISITSAEAKGIITKPNQLHICYLLTPPRYLYSHEKLTKNHWAFKVPVLNFCAQKLFNYLKNWDQLAIYRPDVIIPISELVKKRVKKYYNLETKKVIYPSIINNNNISVNKNNKKYLLSLSRLVAYKKINLSLKIAYKFKEKIVIVGQGPERKNLIKLAKKLFGKNKVLYLDNIPPGGMLKALKNYNCIFVEKIKKTDKPELFINSKALLMPGIEDFGITALEAASFNTPVIINPQSGVTEILQNSGKYDTKYFCTQFSSTIERLYGNFKQHS